MSKSTTNARLALMRLIAEMVKRGINVKEKEIRGEKNRSLVIERPRGKADITYTPRRPIGNLILLADIAHLKQELGGGGFTWAEIKQITGWEHFNI